MHIHVEPLFQKLVVTELLSSWLTPIEPNFITIQNSCIVKDDNTSLYNTLLIDHYVEDMHAGS